MKKILKDLKQMGQRRYPEIAIGFGIAAGITSTVLAVKGTTKAMRLISEAEEEKQERLKPTEVIKTTWTCYIPSAIACAAGITCIVCGTSENLRRNAALISMCKMSETAFTEYTNKVAETVGEEKEKEIRKEVVSDKAKHSLETNCDVYPANSEDVVFFEPISGRKFPSNSDAIQHAVIVTNNKMQNDGYVYLNDLYSAMGIDETDGGDLLGWNSENGIICVSLTTVKVPVENGRVIPGFAICYDTPPTYDFDRFG